MKIKISADHKPMGHLPPIPQYLLEPGIVEMACSFNPTEDQAKTEIMNIVRQMNIYEQELYRSIKDTLLSAHKMNPELVSIAIASFALESQ